MLSFDFLGLDYFFSHGVVIPYMPSFFFFLFFFFLGKQAQRIKDADVVGYFIFPSI